MQIKYTLNEVRRGLIKRLSNNENDKMIVQVFDITFAFMINDGSITTDAIINLENNKKNICYNKDQTYTKTSPNLGF